ncbi:hypothetical protein PV661_09575 [Streptomyces sp. MD20-1-1]|uniref:hypothetical protein n=1 Tax=Streptomyces sp. MD20-1-1 TaxID=3028668 RepID=UPI0029A6C2EB|nr:hypothetical protein [Streptomyces sp. MD20-1-1]
MVVLLLQPDARDGFLKVAGWAASADRDARFVECAPDSADAATCQLGDLMLPQLLFLVELLKALRGQDPPARGASARGGRALLDGARCGGAEGLDREEETGVVQVEQAGELGGLWSVRCMQCEPAAVDRLGAWRKAGIRDPSW